MILFPGRRPAAWGRRPAWARSPRWFPFGKARPRSAGPVPDIGIAQHQGGRAEQQDRVFEAGRQADRPAFALVADGMGGLRAGGAAADLVVETAGRLLDRPPADPEQARRHLAALCRMAHHRILERHGQGHGGREAASGSTVAAAWVGPGWAVWAHVGDTRVYLVRDGRLLRRTRDHSMTEWLYACGAIDEAAIASHPDQNKLTQCLGGPAPPTPDIDHAILQEGDALLLATDGVWAQVPEAAILAAAMERDPAAAADGLVRAAVLAGGPGSDNATVLILRHEASSRRT
ncbi:PP2C family protein-serine/threonine phosphatase [Azospirillum agricola]|uniref:PP2C family protein-serine/threonine phosphatase n=1 Tax=Azospirillum agricola TaxID=1720247 RepID=UPI000A0F048E|nr:protein phosphatase 2C domain-containing protein [Azospirillum agricola]SMH31765.1 Serine/threonine protein phosphatase PrpC [Azospirillum lipoferum]